MPVLDSVVLCEDEVYNVLLNIDPSKALGPDGLPTILLKTCARELTPSHCALLNLSLAEGKLPTKWEDYSRTLCIWISQSLSTVSLTKDCF